VIGGDNRRSGLCGEVKITSRTGNQTQIVGRSASSNLFYYRGPLSLQTAQHVSIIFTIFNNVEFIWKRNLSFRHHIYCIFSERLKYLI